MKKVRDLLKKRSFLFGIAACIVVILVYFLFFKPSPVVRVDWNRVVAKSGDSTILSLQGPAEISGIGKKFEVVVELDTRGYFVNAVQSYIDFDPRAIEVLSTKTDESFCSFYPENNFSNQKGYIKIACGTPYPGFRGKSNMVKIEFMSKAIIKTYINVNKESMVLANDGKGTNLLKNFESLNLEIKAAL